MEVKDNTKRNCPSLPETYFTIWTLHPGQLKGDYLPYPSAFRHKVKSRPQLSSCKLITFNTAPSKGLKLKACSFKKK